MVLLPDDVIDAAVPVTRQLLDVYRRHPGAVVALMKVSDKGGASGGDVWYALIGYTATYSEGVVFFDGFQGDADPLVDTTDVTLTAGGAISFPGPIDGRTVQGTTGPVRPPLGPAP